MGYKFEKVKEIPSVFREGIWKQMVKSFMAGKNNCVKVVFDAPQNRDSAYQGLHSTIAHLASGKCKVRTRKQEIYLIKINE